MSRARRPSVQLRRAEDRFRTTTDWLDSRHSFSYGHHYDPANTSHGVLLVHNDDRVLAGAGFDGHPHREVEIVTWVLQGSLVHRDSTGRSSLVGPGVASRTSAGTGVVHSERNDAHHLPPHPDPQPVRFVQMWVAPDRSGAPPSYDARDVSDDLRSGELVPVVSGLARHAGGSAMCLGNRHAGLHAARLAPARPVRLPDAPFVHVFVARGAVVLEDAGELQEGDAARLTAGGGRTVAAAGPAELLVWEMHVDLAE